MGYRITIGNAVPRTYADEEDREDKERRGYSDRMVELITLLEAPELRVRDRSNTSNYSRTSWAYFADAVGLNEFFNEFDCQYSPSLRSITQADLNKISSALGDHKYILYLAVLNWLDWWMRWAIANCENPSIEVD